MFVKIRDFIRFKGFPVEIPGEQAILRKSKVPRKSPDKWTFLSLAFYNAPSLDTVDLSFPKILENDSKIIQDYYKTN